MVNRFHLKSKRQWRCQELCWKGCVKNECVFEQKGCWAWLTLYAIHVGGWWWDTYSELTKGLLAWQELPREPLFKYQFEMWEAVLIHSVSLRGEKNRSIWGLARKNKVSRLLVCMHSFHLCNFTWFIFRSSYRRKEEGTITFIHFY